MPQEPVDYVIGIQVGNAEELTEEELALISGGVTGHLTPCPSAEKMVICPPPFSCCAPVARCVPC
jgi:bacteriocin-like protein